MEVDVRQQSSLSCLTRTACLQISVFHLLSLCKHWLCLHELNVSPLSSAFLPTALGTLGHDLVTCLQEFSDRRHLLRLWIAPPVERPLPDAYLEIYGGSVDVGNRGGIKVAGYKPTVPLEAE